jgi:ABC-type glycerol-3-phosphate transport system substrate-binding protein
MVILSGSRVAANSTYGPITSPYGVVMSSTGQFVINASIGQDALNTYIKLVSNSEAPLSASFSTVPAYFANGDAAMMLYSASPALYLNNASRSSIPSDWAVAPRMPGGYSILGGVGIGVYKYSQNIPAAVAFVQFATSENESTNFVSLNNLLPFRYSGFTYYGQINPTYSSALASLSSTMAYSIQGYANTAYWPQVSSIFRSAFPDMYSGKVSVTAGTNQVVAQIYSSIGS